MIEAHPHIGTNKLPKIIASMRETILEHGGEIHFNTRVIDFLIDVHCLKGVKTKTGEIFKADQVILEEQGIQLETSLNYCIKKI